MPNCLICKASRWKDPKKTKGKKVANKVVRYFPLTPRLQRMFNTKHIAKWMTWHATGQSKEKGKMNHHVGPLHWKVVEHVFHRDVAESDQDVIHGRSSSDVALSVGLTVLESTDLSINAQSTEVDAPPVNEDNANANEDNADFINNEDD
ncbi:hypothetical protein Tco_1306554, partial [Tanacetum coccineum]